MDTLSSSPWRSMWLDPRRTIREVLDTGRGPNVMLLVSIAGIGDLLNKASSRAAGDEWSLAMILVVALVLGPVRGILSLYVFGTVLKWTGTWIGGRAEKHQVQTAMALADVIPIWAMLLWIPQLLLFGREMFTSELPIVGASTALTILFWSFTAIKVVLGAWAALVFLHCLGEVHGFSALKALGSVVLAALVCLVPVVFVYGSFVLLSLFAGGLS